MIDNTNFDLGDAVQNGLTFLNENCPDWPDRVTKPVDMNSAGLCMLGQLFGTYQQGIAALKLTPSLAVEYGFHVDVRDMEDARALARLKALGYVWTNMISIHRTFRPAECVSAT